MYSCERAIHMTRIAPPPTTSFRRSDEDQVDWPMGTPKTFKQKNSGPKLHSRSGAYFEGIYWMTLSESRDMSEQPPSLHRWSYANSPAPELVQRDMESLKHFLDMWTSVSRNKGVLGARALEYAWKKAFHPIKQKPIIITTQSM